MRYLRRHTLKMVSFFAAFGVFGLLARPAWAEHSNCAVLLQDHSYDCLVTDSLGMLLNAPTCFEFSGPTILLNAGFFGEDYSCVCDTLGTPTKPKFGRSTNFNC